MIQVVGWLCSQQWSIFRSLSIPNPGFALQVFGALQDEGAQNGGNNPQPKNITISSIGGTDLSIFNTGFDINVTGSSSSMMASTQLLELQLITSWT